MNIDRRYVVLLCWFAFSYFNLYNHQNTTDVFFNNDNDSYGAKCKQIVLKTALTLEIIIVKVVDGLYTTWKLEQQRILVLLKSLCWMKYWARNYWFQTFL